ncbi:MAG: FAD:protein FMN transferase [Candidatus Margulisbacteria bacterium]|nr:FAD:protein FMN transferase [Candidatus Margulisiibacteriota bacterium]
MKVRPAYVIFIFLLIAAVFELYYTRLPVTFERTAGVMGTTVRVKVTGPGAPQETARAIDEIKRLDRLLSKFNPDGEIGLINRLAGRAPLEVSADTFDVLKLAVKVDRLSHGAFDITLGQPAGLILDQANRKVKIDNRKLKIDLGGIGKGYAVEAARRLLLKQGVKSAIIDMHSSMAVIGNGWRIGVRDPRRRENVLEVITLNDGESLSTSAQYEQPGHLIDPRTGQPADKCLSVTVVGKDADLADALSTAIFVLGPSEGMRLAKSAGVRAIIVDKNGIIHDNFGLKLR